MLLRFMKLPHKCANFPLSLTRLHPPCNQNRLFLCFSVNIHMPRHNVRMNKVLSRIKNILYHHPLALKLLPGCEHKNDDCTIRKVALGKTHADSHTDSEVGACICVLLFSGPQFVWFITHPSHHYEQFYCFFQWGRFTLYGHAQVAWLQLLFVIKRIGSGIIWFCPVKRWLRVRKPACVGLHEIQYQRLVRGLRADHGPLLRCTKRNLPAIRNDTSVYSLTVPEHITQPMVTGDSDRRRRRSGKTQSTGWSETFQWWKACSVCSTSWNGFSGRTEKAISDGSIWNVHSLPKLMECQSKGKRNGGRGVT